jgi:hypothetical protein
MWLHWILGHCSQILFFQVTLFHAHFSKHSFTQSFNKYLLSTDFVLGTMFGDGVTNMNMNMT